MLREAGVNVVTTDAAPGMQPDVIARGEELPFADGSASTWSSPGSAPTISETSAPRCTRWRASPPRLSSIVDNTFGGEALEEAERLRDPSHVRCYTVEEWQGLFADAGLRIDEIRSLPQRVEVEPWLARAGCDGEEAARVRELAADRIERRLDHARPDGDQGSEVLVAIIVGNDTKLVVQGLTGREGSFHGLRNRGYGTDLVAGVTPGKGGQDVEGVPVFDTVADAVSETGANTSMIFVPARFAADAIYEAVDAGIGTVICISEGLAAHDMLRVYNYIRPRGVTMLGPNCPGALSPGKANVGIIPAEIFSEGSIGLVSRSGTLTYQIGHELTGLGSATRRSSGSAATRSSARPSSTSSNASRPMRRRRCVVMVGEIGGDEEEKAARFIAEKMSKPVVAYIAGFSAPPGKTMGHAGAIITGSSGTAAGEEGSAGSEWRAGRHLADRGRAARRRDRKEGEGPGRVRPRRVRPSC